MRGGERQTRLLIEGLTERGWENYLVVRSDAPFGNSNGLLVKRKFPVKMRGEVDMIAGFQIGKIAKETGVSIIHCHTALAHSLGIFAQMVCGAKLVVTRRVDFGLKSGVISAWKYKRADHIIAISTKIRNIILDAGIDESKVSLVPSGVILKDEIDGALVDELRTDLGADWETKIVGTIAALVGHKDYPTLLRAYQIFAKKFPDSKLICLGEGDDEEQLDQLAWELGIWDNVVFMGYVDNIPDYLGVFSIYVQASKQEGLCSSLIEAMFNYSRIAATSAGGIPDLIEDGVTGLLSEPGDHEGLAASMIRLAEDDKLAFELGQGAHRKSLDFSAEAMVEKNEQVYMKLLDGDDA